MKLQTLILTVLMAGLVGLVGCSKKSSVDTAPLEKSFQTADTTTKASVDTVVSAVKSADYSSAVAGLQKLAADAKLTPEQQQAVKDVLAQVQKVMADAAGKAAGDATKAAPDLLPK